MKQEGEMKILRVESKNEDGKGRNENQFTIAKSASTSLPGMKSHARIFFFFIFACFAAVALAVVILSSLCIFHI